MRGSVKVESFSKKESKLLKPLSIMLLLSALLIAFDKSCLIRSISSLTLCGWWSGSKKSLLCS
jgi:hypothetical protein